MDTNSFPPEKLSGEPSQRGDRGFVMITFALLLIPIVTFTALAIDVSSWYSRATELQRSADAAALAGVVWMPDLNAADGAGIPVMTRNGFVNGAKNITVSTSVGSTSASSYRVCVTDTRVRQFFSSVFAGAAKITRCATAEYNNPLELGSPLNYFGGNQTLSSYVPGTQPANAAPPTPNPSVFANWGYSRCLVLTSYPGGSSAGYWDRVGSTNPQDWRYYTTYGGTGFPYCQTPPAAVPDLASTKGGSFCRVVVGGTEVGYWYHYTSGGFPSSWRYRAQARNQGDPTCGYNGTTNSPIPSDKSPNFWAAVEGYQNDHANGDVYSTNGSQYRDTGYFYSIDIPSNFTAASVSFQIWDGSANCDLGCRTPMGDDGGPHTRFRVFKAGVMKYDMSTITPAVCTSGSNDSGYITSSSAWNLKWNEICNAAASPGDRFYLEVQSSDSSSSSQTGGGYNGYAFRAVAGAAPTNFPASCIGVYMGAGSDACYNGSPATTQPRVSGFGDMEMYNGIPESTPTEFYLANVTPQYAGKTLEITLWDPGDGAPSSWITVMGPSSGSPLGAPISSSNCDTAAASYGPGTFSSIPLSTGPGGAYSGTCTVQTSSGGSNAYNNMWVRFRIKLPADYGTSGGSFPCNQNVADPTTTAGSCWWQIKYYTQGGSLSDYTTWTARIIGDPVRLTM